MIFTFICENREVDIDVKAMTFFGYYPEIPAPVMLHLVENGHDFTGFPTNHPGWFNLPEPYKVGDKPVRVVVPGILDLRLQGIGYHERRILLCMDGDMVEKSDWEQVRDLQKHLPNWPEGANL